MTDALWDDLATSGDPAVTDDLAPPEAPQRPLEHLRHQQEFITRLLDNPPLKEVDQLLRQGLNLEVFDDPTMRPPVAWIIKHFQTTRALPSLSELQSQFPEIERCLLPPSERGTLKASDRNLRSLFVATAEAMLGRGFVKLIIDASNDWQKNRPIRATWDTFKLQSRALDRIASFGQDQVLDLNEAFEQVQRQYGDAEAGKAWGVPCPFPFIQAELLGFQRANIVTIVAKTGTGKTFGMLMCACTAATGNPWLFTSFKARHGRLMTPAERAAMQDAKTKVLFVSMEMPNLECAERTASLLTHVSYPLIRAGRLDATTKTRFFAEMEKARQQLGQSIRFITATTPEQVAAHADDFGAGVVMIDGFYLMNGDGERRWERVQSNMQLMRQHSLQSGRPYVLASQLDGQDDRLAFSQAIEQDSSYILQMQQSANDKQVRRMRMKMRKARSAASGDEYFYDWDIPNCRYGEQGRVAVATDGADL